MQPKNFYPKCTSAKSLFSNSRSYSSIILRYFFSSLFQKSLVSSTPMVVFMTTVIPCFRLFLTLTFKHYRQFITIYNKHLRKSKSTEIAVIQAFTVLNSLGFLFDTCLLLCSRKSIFHEHCNGHGSYSSGNRCNIRCLLLC